jgi:hypoxanthine phosphoribosyltransferase
MPPTSPPPVLTQECKCPTLIQSVPGIREITVTPRKISRTDVTMNKTILFSRQAIEEAITELARRINADYRGRPLVLVGILKGSFVFLADLIRKLDLDVTVDFVVLGSYGSGTTTSGEVKMLKDLSAPIEGKEVLVVEDIVDTGITLTYFMDTLRRRRPASLAICALIDKKARREVQIDVKYVGIEMEDGFIVGYGIDCNEQYRNLPDIWVLRDEEGS